MKRGRGLGGALTAVTGVFGRATNQVIALTVTLLAARWLTPVTFGAFSIAAALATLSRAMLYAGAFEYLLKAPEGEEANTECLVLNLGLAATMGGLLALVSLVASSLFHSRDVGWLLLALSPSCLLSAVANWQESQLLRSGRLKTYYGVTTTAEITAAIVTIGLILSGFGLGALVVQIYARLMMLIVTYRLLQRPRWSSRFSGALAMRVIRWSTTRYGTTLVAFLSNYSADILLGVFLSPAATGLYRASHRMVTGVSDLISNPTRLTAVTVFSGRSARGEASDSLWPRVAAATAFLGWTALAGLAAISSLATPFVLGAHWAGAGPIVAILCLQRAFNLLDGITGPLLVAYSHLRDMLIVQLAMAITGVLLLVLLARFGVAAAAVSSVVAAAGTSLLLIVLAARLFPGLLAGLPRMLPVALLPAAATGSAAWAVGRLMAGSLHATPEIVGCQIGAGALAFALTSAALRREVMEALHALNQPQKIAAVVEEEGEVAFVAG